VYTVEQQPFIASLCTCAHQSECWLQATSLAPAQRLNINSCCTLQYVRICQSHALSGQNCMACHPRQAYTSGLADQQDHTHANSHTRALHATTMASVRHSDMVPYIFSHLSMLAVPIQKWCCLYMCEFGCPKNSF